MGAFAMYGLVRLILWVCGQCDFLTLTPTKPRVEMTKKILQCPISEPPGTPEPPQKI